MVAVDGEERHVEATDQVIQVVGRQVAAAKDQIRLGARVGCASVAIQARINLVGDSQDLQVRDSPSQHNPCGQVIRQNTMFGNIFPPTDSRTSHQASTEGPCQTSAPAGYNARPFGIERFFRTGESQFALAECRQGVPGRVIRAGSPSRHRSGSPLGYLVRHRARSWLTPQPGTRHGSLSGGFASEPSLLACALRFHG